MWKRSVTGMLLVNSIRKGPGRKRAVLVRSVNGGDDVERRRSLETLHAPQPVCDGAVTALK
jgi:hypothetical protein